MPSIPTIEIESHPASKTENIPDYPSTPSHQTPTRITATAPLTHASSSSRRRSPMQFLPAPGQLSLAKTISRRLQPVARLIEFEYPAPRIYLHLPLLYTSLHAAASILGTVYTLRARAFGLFVSAGTTLYLSIHLFSFLLSTPGAPMYTLYTLSSHSRWIRVLAPVNNGESAARSGSSSSRFIGAPYPRRH